MNNYKEFPDQASVISLGRDSHKAIHKEYDGNCQICRFWFTDPNLPKVKDTYRMIVLDFSEKYKQ